jgi:hypothetical protein
MDHRTACRSYGNNHRCDALIETWPAMVSHSLPSD